LSVEVQVSEGRKLCGHINWAAEIV
jgi:hypothetical protein